jgi:hypothetical protein
MGYINTIIACLQLPQRLQCAIIASSFFASLRAEFSALSAKAFRRSRRLCAAGPVAPAHGSG